MQSGVLFDSSMHLIHDPFTTQVVKLSEDILSDEQVKDEVALFFVSPDHGILLQEYQSIDAEGVCVLCFF